MPSLDLVCLLRSGADGHCASLYSNPVQVVCIPGCDRVYLSAEGKGGITLSIDVRRQGSTASWQLYCISDAAVENSVKLYGSTFKDRQLQVKHKRINEPDYHFSSGEDGGGGGYGGRGRGGGRGGYSGGGRGGRDSGYGPPFRGSGGRVMGEAAVTVGEAVAADEEADITPITNEQGELMNQHM
eukprot:scaffold109649_cov52-Attheya_sp.AAC.2